VVVNSVMRAGRQHKVGKVMELLCKPSTTAPACRHDMAAQRERAIFPMWRIKVEVKVKAPREGFTRSFLVLLVISFLLPAPLGHRCAGPTAAQKFNSPEQPLKPPASHRSALVVNARRKWSGLLQVMTSWLGVASIKEVGSGEARSRAG